VIKNRAVLCTALFSSILFICCTCKISGDTSIKPPSDISEKKATNFSFEYKKISNKLPDEIKAFYQAYYQFIDKIEYANEDWIITLSGIELFWAEGKLLPSDKKPEEHKYRSYGFYKYPDDFPKIIKNPDPQMLERFNRYAESRKNLQRDDTFLEILYNGKSLEEIQKHLKIINFLGFKVQVHESIADKYYAIDKEIKEEALKNPEIKQFLASLGYASAFIWRDIEDSTSDCKNSSLPTTTSH